MVEFYDFLIDVIAKDFHAVIASAEPQQILYLSICKAGVHTESEGSVAVDFSHVGSFKIEFGLILQTLKNCFKVSVNG